MLELNDTLDDFINNSYYSFFSSLYEFEKLHPGYQMYDPPYFLTLKLRNYSDSNEVFLKTEKVLIIKELPQNIYEIVNKYESIQNYIQSCVDDLYLHFDIKFFSELGFIDQVYYIKVIKLKKIFN